MTTQPRARITDPQTSHDAAKKVRGVSAVHSIILMILWQRGPLTDPKIAEYYNQRVADGTAPMHSASGLRTRRKELVDMGKVSPAAWKEKLSTGRYATVWAWETEEAPTVRQNYDGPGETKTLRSFVDMGPDK